MFMPAQCCRPAQKSIDEIPRDELSTAFELATNDASYFYAQPDGFSSAHRNYGFIYDYNQTNVAHGANSGLHAYRRREARREP